MSNANVFDRMQQIMKRGDAVYLEKPLVSGQIEALRNQVLEQLSDQVPAGYLTLLKLTDGVQINNAVIHNGKDFLEENSELRAQFPKYRQYLSLGYQGNMDRYLFNKGARRFEVTNFFNPEEVVDAFDSFEALLAYLLKRQEVDSEAEQ
jgi:hypothetical protein